MAAVISGGTSFVRNSMVDMQNGSFDPANTAKSGLATFYLLGPDGLGFRSVPMVPIEVPGGGPRFLLRRVEFEGSKFIKAE